MKKTNSPYMGRIEKAIENEDARQTCISASEGVGHYIDHILPCLSNTPVVDMPLILTALKHIVKIISKSDPTSADLSLTIDNMVVFPEVQITQYKKSKGGKQNGSYAE